MCNTNLTRAHTYMVDTTALLVVVKGNLLYISLIEYSLYIEHLLWKHVMKCNM